MIAIIVNEMAGDKSPIVTVGYRYSIPSEVPKGMGDL
jgi:hypothetical protein